MKPRLKKYSENFTTTFSKSSLQLCENFTTIYYNLLQITKIYEKVFVEDRDLKIAFLEPHYV